MSVTRIRIFQFLTALVLACAGTAAAHDIPNDATARILIKPTGGRLQLLTRVPLKVVRDLDFPERPDGYLDVEKLDPLLPDTATLWIAGFVEIYEGQTRLPAARVLTTRISIESDRSFASFPEALAHVTGPKLANSANVLWNQVFLDALFEYPIQSDQSEFSIQSRLDQLAARMITVVQFIPPNGAVRVYEFSGDPGLVALDPGWSQAARRFIELGFLHILDGTDHLLFLFCLVIPFRRLRPLVLVVTAFTVAHSITLFASAYNLVPDALWFPPLIETLIAASIVYMALENIVGSATTHRRWITAFGFGLVHGFGFSFVLRETLQFGGSHLLASLLWFNIGVELGQLLVLLLLVPALDALFRFVVAERMGTIILSALVAHTGWHWMMDRWDQLRQFPIHWPAFNAPLVTRVIPWIALVLVCASLIWTFKMLRQRWNREAQSKGDLGTQIE